MKHFRMLLCLVVFGLLFSCETIGQLSSQQNLDFVVRGKEQNPDKLKKNQFLSATGRLAKAQYLEASNWSKVRIISDFLDEIKGHAEFSNDEKYEMLSYIFDKLPINGKKDLAREVFIGRYFENGDPLILRIFVLTPPKEEAEKDNRVIIIVSNIVKTLDGTRQKMAGAFINMQINATLVCGFRNNLLTNVLKAEKDEPSPNIEALTAVERIMLAQAYLQDENIKNDITANRLVSQILDSAEEIPSVVILAMLMQYNYFLSIEDVEAAEKLWNSILAYSENIPGDMNPETLETINGASLYLMKKLLSKNL